MKKCRNNFSYLPIMLFVCWFLWFLPGMSLAVPGPTLPVFGLYMVVPGLSLYVPLVSLVSYFGFQNCLFVTQDKGPSNFRLQAKLINFKKLCYKTLTSTDCKLEMWWHCIQKLPNIVLKPANKCCITLLMHTNTYQYYKPWGRPKNTQNLLL